MYLDGARHSATDLDDPDRHVFSYTEYFHLPMLMVDDPDEIDRVLFVGGGGYTGPQDFAEQYDVAVDVVELDPEVTDAAETYFGLDRGEMNVYTEDGRQFLQGTDETYDLIVLDAFKKDQVPFHLTTVEFMELLSDRLSDDGIVHANVISSPTGPASEFYRAQYKTVAEVFPTVYSYRTSDSNAVQNVPLVATKNETRLSQSTLADRNEARDLSVDLAGPIDNTLAEPETDDAPVLRDDRGEVDSLLDPMLGQRYVIEETDDPDATGEPAATTGTVWTAPRVASG